MEDSFDLPFKNKQEDILWNIIMYCRNKEKMEIGSGSKLIDELLHSIPEIQREEIKKTLSMDSKELLNVNFIFING